MSSLTTATENLRRRTVLKTLATGCLPLVMSGQGQAQALVATPAHLISAAGADDASYALAVTGAGTALEVQTGFRGHEVIAHPLEPDMYLYFARRPGTRSLLINGRTGRVVHEFHAVKNHHFCGHGFADPLTRRLYTTEVDLTTGKGCLGVRDLGALDWVDCLPSYGVEPHQVLGLPDQRTLVIANGGLKTQPDDDREVVNLATMRSNLVFVDRNDGRKLAEFSVPEPKASLRHLAVAVDGTVVVAAQVQRQVCGHSRPVQLAAVLKPGGELTPLTCPTTLLTQMRDYAGSVAINDRTRTAGVTSPRGNLVLFWDLDSAQLLSHHAFFDVCGIAVTPDEGAFVLTNSQGEVRYLDAVDLIEMKARRQRFSNLAFDNHLLIQATHS